jgi:hypothetical protein
MVHKPANKAIDSHERVDVDTYDRGIIPAEVAARKAREGDKFKQLPTEETLANSPTDDQTNIGSIRTTDGYTIDQEGLLNNYPVEPEMYYEVPGDAREVAAEDAAERMEELLEVNEDNAGKLTETDDTRGKGPGII